MNYLVIKNQGLIEPEDLYLIGSSTKREDETKIGMFGSGWKFALAWLMRNECLPTILSGNKLIEIDFNIVLHRDNPVKVITIMGKETSLTSEMGLKWTGWMALREIISNAIDEGSYTITNQWNPSDFSGEEGFTTIYIPMNNELADVLRSFNNYFAFERTVSYENSVGKVYVKREESEMVIYRKGIRCYDTRTTSTIDFNFNDIEINESRLSESYHVSNEVFEFVSVGVSTPILKVILENSFTGWLDYKPSEAVIANLTELIQLGEVFTCPTLQGIGGMFLVQNPTLMIPNKWYTELAELGLIENPFMQFMDSGAPKDFIQTDARNSSGIQYYLSGFNMKYNIFTGVFSGRNIIVSGNNAYINDDCTEDDKTLAAKIIVNTRSTSIMEMML